MQVLLTIYRRLDLVQRGFWFKIAASALVLALCAGTFGTLLVRSYSLHGQRQALLGALSGANLQRGDEHAVSLKSSGQVFLNNRTYGGAELLEVQLFAEDGSIARPGPLTERLLADQRPAWAPDWLLEQPQTTWMLALIMTGWLLLIIWLEIALPFVLTLLGTLIPVAVCWWFDWPQAMLAAGGVGLLTFTFVLLTRAALVALFPANQILAVAHTVVKEASRRGISLMFIVLLLIVLPLIPIWLDPESPLRYRIQTFISLSLGLTFAVTSVMTLLFSCASVAFEIRDRQIWHLMTKPLARINYLMGKWVGVLVVNLIILMVAGVSTFTFIQYMRTLPVAQGEAGQFDALAVRDEVLTARIGAAPDYEQLSGEQIRARVLQRIANDPDLAARQEITTVERLKLERDEQQRHTAGQRTVPPYVPGGPLPRTYIFRGLQHAKNLNATLTLRYRFHIMRDDEHQLFRAIFVFVDTDDQPLDDYQSKYVPTMSHSFPLSTALIQDDGTLRVKIFNLFDPGEAGGPGSPVGALNFEEKDFELLYKAGSFEGNFVRALLTAWIKLAFLAALGICCSTFLSFPVACLLSFTVFMGGMLGPFIAQALHWYYPPEASQMDWGDLGMVFRWVFETFTRAVAQVIVFLLSAFGEYKPAQSLVEGRLIPWSAVTEGFAKLGLLWSGLSMVIGYLVMRNRQLAIYSGQG